MKLHVKLSLKRFVKVAIAGIVPVAANFALERILPDVRGELANAVPEAVKPLVLPVLAGGLLAVEKYLKELKRGTK